MRPVTREEYEEWLQHPVTMAIAASREDDVRRVQEFLGNGGTIDADNTSATAINTAINIGYIKGLREALAPLTTID